MVSITKQTEDFIKNRPHLIHGLSEDLLNYSKVARYIGRKIGTQKHAAILVAARRFKQKIVAKGDHDILRVLKGSSLVVRTDIAAVILKPDVLHRKLIEFEIEAHKNNDPMRIISSESATILLVPISLVPLVLSKLKDAVVKVNKGLVEICLKSSARLESIPGVMGFLYSLLGENGINIKETMSCWTDTILVIEKQDLNRTLELLSFN